MHMTPRRAAGWIPWLLGAAALAALVAVVLHLAEERAFLHLLEQSQPGWLVLAVALQAVTYLAQARVWNVVLSHDGHTVPGGFACRLSLAKLFVDQAVPSMGLSGAALVTRALGQRGVPRDAALAAVTVDAASFYLAYVIDLAIALALLVHLHHATPLVIGISVLFLVYGSTLATALLVLPGSTGGRSTRARTLPLLGRILAVMQDVRPSLLRIPSVLARCALLQMAIAALDAATLWLLLRALGTEASVAGVYASFMMASVMRSLGVLPGGLGTFEAASVAALAVAGIPVAAGLAATLLFRGLSFWLPMLPGLALSRALTLGPRTAREETLVTDDWSPTRDEVLRRLGSSLGGLSAEEAARRSGQYGPNAVGEFEGLTRLGVLWNQLRSPLLLLLVFAAAVSVMTGEWTDAIIVLTIVAASVGIGYSREYRAQTAAAELRAKVQVQANALRDGRSTPVPVRDLVPGDVVLLAAGSIIPADCRLLEANDCFVNEAVLTGESFPVQKSPAPVAPDTPLVKRTDCLYFGTHVRSGSGTAVVVATGAATAFGSIAHRLQLRPPETEFDRGVRHFGYLLTTAMSAMMLVVLVANLLLGRPLIETLLFAIALAVGLSPELLPAILSVNLARGARGMAQHGVLVRRLNAIENLGSMDVLCTDKTGTLTEGVVQLDGAWDAMGQASEDVRRLGGINAALQSGLANPLDEAILAAGVPALADVCKVAEIPYDFVRKRLSVVVDSREGRRLITKGAFEQVLEICPRGADGRALDDDARAALRALTVEWAERGIRVLAVAARAIAPAEAYGRDDEHDLEFRGFLTFLDRPKAGVQQALDDLAALGVGVKLITGDAAAVARYVAAKVGMRGDRMLTGAQLDQLHDDALWRAAEDTDLFVEVDPNQKERIILALKKAGRVVGFLGDGINDAPAMHAADTSLSVEGAVDVAREAADFVLLERDLDVIRQGIEEGRRTFANTLKYVLTTTSANLGNMISMAVASLFLPFLPLLAGQILLNNFLSDIPAVGLADDSVDREMIERPRRWNMRFLGRFMIEFGCLSSLFDFLTFGLLLGVFAASPELFRTGWFVESLQTELLVALVVRTRRPFWQSRPGTLLLWSSLALMALTFAIPYLPGASLLEFVPLPAPLLGAIAAIVLLYAASTEGLKASFYRRRGD